MSGKAARDHGPLICGETPIAACGLVISRTFRHPEPGADGGRDDDAHWARWVA
jgi:hypothetical protein